MGHFLVEYCYFALVKSYIVRFFLSPILCCIVFISAGQSQLDSLQRLINKENDPKRKVELLNVLSFSLFGIDVAKSDSTTRQALVLARKIGDKSGEGWACAYRGIYLLFSAELNEAEKCLAHSLALGQNIQDTNLQTYSFIQIGNVFRDKGVFDSAYRYYELAERTIQQKPDAFYQSVVKMNKARYYLILSKPDSALREVREAEKLRESLTDRQMMPDVWLLLGNCYREKYDLEMAVHYYDLVEKVVPTGTTLHAQYLLNMGEVYFRQGDFPKALKNWGLVLAFHRKLNYKYELASLLYRMGEVFEEQGYYDLASEYLSNSLSISEKASYRYLMGEVYYELGWVFYRSKNLDLAIQNIRRAEPVFKETKQELRLAGCLNIRALIQMKKRNYDSSLYYHRLSLKDRERIGNAMAVSSSLHNLGELYNTMNEPKRALPYLWKGVKIDEQVGDSYGRSIYYFQLGKSYNLLGGSDSTKFYLDKALELAVPVAATDVVRISYGEMADYLQKIGQPAQAIAYYKKFIQLNDSLFNKQTSQSLASYRTLYDVEKKEREIDLLNKDNLIAKAQSEEQKVLFYSAMAGLLVLIATVAFYYRFAKRLSAVNQEVGKSNANLKGALDDLHKTQAQLIQAEKMASLGLLSSGVAHELNNPLNFIKGGVNALTTHLNESQLKEVKPYVDIVNEGVNRAAAILKGLGHFSRQSDRQNEMCDLHKIMDNCLLILNNKLKHRITIEKHYTQAPVVMSGNEGRLHQAFLNILSNAEQAILDNGTIRIETSVNDKTISVAITDTGIGISEENLPRISEPFFTTKPAGQGTGLGLYITYSILEEHRGKVYLKSEVNKGTEFLVLFTL